LTADCAARSSDYQLRHSHGSVGDKILVCSTFIAFVGRGWMPAWMAVVVVAREWPSQDCGCWRLEEPGAGGGRIGKHKTISQIVAILWSHLPRFWEWGPVGQTIFGFPAGRRGLNG